MEQEADIAPPPYNVANVHSSDHLDSQRDQEVERIRRWEAHLQAQREAQREREMEMEMQARMEMETEMELMQGQGQGQVPLGMRVVDDRMRDRSNSDSRSSEMGFGQSHHAGNHML